MPRGTPPGAVALVVAVLGAGLLGACDTGDGKTLRPPTEPPPTTTTSVPPSNPIETAAVAPTSPVPAGFRLLTPWADGSVIDVDSTCEGADRSPPISWTDVPDGTAELAVVFVDLDVSGDDGRPFLHWLVTGIDPSVASFAGGDVPPGAREHMSSFGDAAYGGPCPPGGEEHRYELTVHALNQPLDLADDTAAAEVVDRIMELTIDSATVVGSFSR
jgi:Raf kinase inhibitor-like YbhB/YbcL family protein